jgi:hypothetical protein
MTVVLITDISFAKLFALNTILSFGAAHILEAGRISENTFVCFVLYVFRV